MMNVLDQANEVTSETEQNVNEAAQVTNENVSEVNNDTIAADQDTQEQSTKTQDNLQGCFYLFIYFVILLPMQNIFRTSC
jgi:hypothetical protein